MSERSTPRRRFGIAWKLGALVLVSFGGMALVLLAGISGLRTAMHADREQLIRSVVEVVASQIEADGTLMLAGTMTRDTFMCRARTLVASTRYGGGDYVFMYAWDGTNVADGGWPGNVGCN